jgi:hypothetical protein
MAIHDILMAASSRPNPDFIASEQAQLTSSSGTLTINKPTGTQQGDIMVAVTASDNGTNMSELSGWTRVVNVISDNFLTVQYKVAGGSEPSSYSFTCSSTSRLMSGCIATFRNCTYDIKGSSSTTTSGNPVNAPSITPTLADSILLAIFANEDTGDEWSPPSGMTLVATDNYNQGGANLRPCFAVFYQENVAASATGTRTCDLNSAGQTSGILIALKPT